MHDRGMTINQITVEPHLSKPRFNRTPRLFELFANSPEIRILFHNSFELTAINRPPLFRTKFRVPLEKTLINRTFPFSKSENAEKQQNKEDIFVISRVVTKF